MNIIHRGIAYKKLKENCFKSFKESFNKKYGIETDIHFTKDNKIICFHDFTLNRLFKINKSIKNLNFDEIKNKTKSKISDEVLKPLLDDLNTPGYIANLHKLYDKAVKGSDEDKILFISACNFIGLLNETKEDWLKFKKNKVSISENEILIKINQRNEARVNKNYKEADKIRDELLDKGVLIEDKDGKTTWKFK